MASQVLVRVVLALVTYTVFVNTGALASDGTVVERGTARATDCDRVGPISRSGLGWYWSCNAEITWPDGRTGRSSFESSQLTPQNRTEPASVVRQEVRNRGHMIQVDAPAPFAGLGWALFLPLIATTAAGIRIPGIPPVPPEQRAERHQRTRLQWWQPLALPIGWGLVVAGGLATAAPAVPGLAVLTIVLGYGVLTAGWVVSLNRRRQGVAEPRTPSPENVATYARWGRRLRALGGAAAGMGIVVSFPNWSGALGMIAVPLALVVLGWRMTVVANRHVRHTEKTDRERASS